MRSTKNKVFSFVRRTKDIKKRFFADTEEIEENKKPTFSGYFLKFFQAMTLWETPSLWSDAIIGIFHYIKCPSVALFFSNYPKTIHNERKSQLKDIEKIYTLFLNSCNYLIKMNVEYMLKTFFQINMEKQHMKTNQYETITQNLESIQFMEGLNKIIRKRPTTRIEKVLFVLKKSIDFIKVDQDCRIMEILLINKQFKKDLFKKVVKQFLKVKIIDKKKRVAIWGIIAKTGTISKHFHSNNSQPTRNILTLLWSAPPTSKSGRKTPF